MAELPRWKPTACAMSAKFKAFSFPVIKSCSTVPVFRPSVIPVSQIELPQPQTIMKLIITTTCYHIRHIRNPSMSNCKFMKPNYHNHLLPYKVAVELAAVCEEPQCELQQSFKFELYSNLYQSTHMKSTPEN